MPIERSERPVMIPAASAAAGWPAPSSRGDCPGGPGMRLTSPPSWSVAMSRRGLPPATAARCSCATTRRMPAAPVGGTLSEKRITPPTSPRSTRWSRLAGGIVMSRYATTNFCPTSRASDDRGGRRRVGGVTGAAVVTACPMTLGSAVSLPSSPSPKQPLRPPANIVIASPGARILVRLRAVVLDARTSADAFL